jgi:hypothetical protein
MKRAKHAKHAELHKSYVAVCKLIHTTYNNVVKPSMFILSYTHRVICTHGVICTFPNGIVKSFLYSAIGFAVCYIKFACEYGD